MMEEGAELINRPFLDLRAAADLLMKLYELKAADIEEMKSFTDQNFHIKLDIPITVGCSGNERSDQFVLKLYNSKDSTDGNRVELAVNTMAYLSNKEFCCPQPVCNKHGKLVHLEKVSCDEGNTGVEGNNGKHGLFLVVLLSFMPGQLLSSLDPMPKEVIVCIGRKLAQLHKILEASLVGSADKDCNLQRLVKDFEDYNREKPSTYCSGEWSLERVTGQRHLLDLVDDTRLRAAIAKVIDLYEEHVEPVRHLFKKGIIHGDINNDNVIISKQLESHQPSNERFIVSGIIDFGEAAYSCLIFDLAVGLSELVLVNGTSASKHFLQGYLSLNSIPDVEKKLLYYLVLVRYAQRIMLSLEAKPRDPLNDYITQDVENCAGLLLQLLQMQKGEVETIWNI
eukprot:XP_011672397.1 PREDICTED: hydroxylysine kinase isoform X1 [Strongylocentrotus purpuratus]